jgi:hypothetical protein
VPLERVEWPLDRTRRHFDAIIDLAGGLEQEKGNIDLLMLPFSRRNGSPGKNPFGSAQGKLTFILMAH